VAAGRFQLAALVFDLPEQPRVLDGQGGLRAKVLSSRTTSGSNTPASARHGQHADDLSSLSKSTPSTPIAGLDEWPRD
jgi:hypothetical protein